MKVLDEYFLMVALLLNRVHIFANFMFNSWTKKQGSERIKVQYMYTSDTYNVTISALVCLRAIVSGSWKAQ